MELAQCEWVFVMSGGRMEREMERRISLGRRPPGRTRDMLEGLGVPADLVAPQGPLEELDQVDEEREAWAADS